MITAPKAPATAMPPICAPPLEGPLFGSSVVSGVSVEELLGSGEDDVEESVDSCGALVTVIIEDVSGGEEAGGVDEDFDSMTDVSVGVGVGVSEGDVGFGVELGSLGDGVDLMVAFVSLLVWLSRGFLLDSQDIDLGAVLSGSPWSARIIEENTKTK